MSLGTIQAGRLALVELPKNPAADTVSAGQPWQLTLTGQQAYPVQTLAQIAAAREDLLGMTGALIPVVCTDKSEVNGYYLVAGATASDTNWSNTDAVTLDWQLTLTRLGRDTEIDLESRLTGPSAVNNSFSATGEQTAAPPIGGYGFWSGSTLPSSMTRTSADGAITVYRSVPLVSTLRWGCPVGSYGGGRARIIDAGALERSGLNYSPGATGWQLHNALVKVAVGTGHTLDVSAWTGGAWQAIGWNLQVTGSLTTLGAPSTVTPLRNDYESATVRLLWDTAPGRITADLTVRRGSRLLELYVQAESSTTLKLVRASTEAGTSATGYVRAAANDGAGNRYVIGSAHTMTADTVNGGISVSSTTTLDAFVGVAAGGSGAVSGDAPADLFAQYIGRRAEYVQGVRR